MSHLTGPIAEQVARNLSAAVRSWTISDLIAQSLIGNARWPGAKAALLPLLEADSDSDEGEIPDEPDGPDLDGGGEPGTS